FGIVHVDYDTQVRTPKASFHWMRDFIADPVVAAPVTARPATTGPVDILVAGTPRGERPVGD
ncbi:hypothetical protein ACWEQG_38740, partial [Microbispora sp. NPDC004025]